VVRLPGTLYAVRPLPGGNAPFEVRATAPGAHRVIASFPGMESIHRFAYWLQEPFPASPTGGCARDARRALQRHPDHGGGTSSA
jgi:hypothetical protein